MQILNCTDNTWTRILVIFLVAALIFNTNCGGSRIERITVPPAELDQFKSNQEFPFLKLHIKSGELYVLENWNVKNDTVSGKGKFLDMNRNPVSEGDYRVPVDQIILAESNHIKSAIAPGVLIGLTVVTGIFTIVCITNPKACFGSCPTFYASNGDDYLVQSEGFSSSISPSLEARDIDALYRIKPESENFEIQLRNEAYETHVIRSANILAVPKPPGGRVFATLDDKFIQVNKIIEASEVSASEGDISEKFCTFDGIERFSIADSYNLAAKETIDITFNEVPVGDYGLVIASRQTLLTTFLFYQTLEYMGSTTGDWLAHLERNSGEVKKLLERSHSVLGNIEILTENEEGVWVNAGEIGETGPIATDIKIVPLKNINYQESGNSSVKLKLQLTKGLWRIDYVALAELGNKVTPFVIPPSTSTPQFLNSSNVVELLTNPDSVLVTFPGDKYFLNYKLPPNYSEYELFLKSQGYYLEWMRNEWLGKEDPGKLYQMLFNPDQFYKDLAPQFKKIESEMEGSFWSSKYVHP